MMNIQQTFWSLLDFCEIEIPILQRDYAQGREDKAKIEQIRYNFVNTLFEMIEDESKSIDLDFIYGKISNNVLTLLDGQQRLTTLFLLHWYIAKKCGKSSGEIDKLNRFSYKTRVTSTEFCEALINKNNGDLLIKENLSEAIGNSSWFFSYWKKDPTVKGMLIMLDAIHNKFKDLNNELLWGKLINKNNPPLTFSFLNMDDFSLTDDLYIKMNSRGKPLSDFENFKAWLEKNLNENNIKIPEWKTKIDKEWTDLFWKYKDESNFEIDEEYLTFFNSMALFFYVENATVENNKITKESKEIIDAYRKTNYIPHSIYEKNNSFSEKNINNIFSVLHSIDNGGDEIIKEVLKELYPSKLKSNLLLKKIIGSENSKINLWDRTFNYAFVKFLLVKEKKLIDYSDEDKKQFFQWIRICKNLIYNTPIESPVDFVTAIRKINELTKNCTNIYKYLAPDNNSINFFSSWQVKEEKVKAHLMLKSRSKSEKWEEIILKAEKHPYLKGQIGFLLEFTGILEYYEKNSNCDWNNTENDSYFNSFKNYVDKAIATFNFISKENKDLLWKRAVLSKGDYLISRSSDRKNFLNLNINIRDFSWKRLLRLNPKKDDEDWKKKRNYVKKVFDDENFDCNNVKESLIKIITNRECNDMWREYFIKNPKLIEYCKQGYIHFAAESNIMLYNASQMNHKHRELYSYNLYLNYLENNINDFKLFSKCSCPEVTGGAERPYTVLKGWKYNNLNYAIKIYYNLNNNKKFNLCFLNEENKEIDNNIISILKKNSMERQGEANVYETCIDGEETTINYIRQFCQELNEIKELNFQLTDNQQNL